MLIVPDDAVKQYKAHTTWKKFMIETPTRMASFSGTTREESIYDMNGRHTNKPQTGINIIRYSDGTTRKVLWK